MAVLGCRILLTGFRHTSAEWLVMEAIDCDRLFLPNDKQKDAELLTYQLLNTQYDFIVCIGQKPNIKDKIHIETAACENGAQIKTGVDCQKLAHLFEACGLQAKLSSNAGTSFCNALYFKGLQFITEYDLKTGLVFVHIPFQKNISRPDLFNNSFFDVVNELKRKGVEDLWIK